MKLIESKHNYCTKLTDAEVMQALLEDQKVFKASGCLQNHVMSAFYIIDVLSDKGYNVTFGAVSLSAIRTLAACQRCKYFNGDWSEIAEVLECTPIAKN